MSIEPSFRYLYIFPVRDYHWLKGGTGVTNFSPKNYDAYDIAVRKYNESQGETVLVLSRTPFGMHYYVDSNSLHYFDRAKTRDLGDFWKTFEDVQTKLKRREEIEAEIIKLSKEDEDLQKELLD